MTKKLRVSILYNEPTSGADDGRQYISEAGALQRAGSHSPRGGEHAGSSQEAVDLSEVGVLEEMEDIKAALNSLGYRTSIFNVNSNIYRLVDHLRDDRPDLVFNLVECVENEALQEMHVAGLYELLKIPYTGAGPLALGTALNKPRVKELLSRHGILTPAYHLFELSSRITIPEGMVFPMIVKPEHEDGSVGISESSVVTNPAELRKRVRYVFVEFEQAALVEQYIEGRELNIAIIGYRNPVTLPISEIDFSGLKEGMRRIVSYEAKWMHGTVAYEGTKGVCPADLTAQQEERMKETALRCFRLIGCRDYARVDFRMTEDGEIYVLEVNPNPDISDDAGFARSARAHGLAFQEIVGKIVESALERQRMDR
ncbi:MAG: ATP-grasp domain-containing protein [Bacteroidetes bacterium]|nr:ATP-grasp domain-containing protein [Bacteroidota bacterium]